MTFGRNIRQIRRSKNLSQRQLAAMTGINFTYISRIENGKLEFSEFPSEATIHKLADALDADEEELLLMAKKIPASIRERVLEQPDAFRKIARLDDAALDKLVRQIDPE